MDILRIERDNTWGGYEMTGNKHIEEVVHSMVIINHLLHSITVLWERLDRAKTKTSSKLVVEFRETHGERWSRCIYIVILGNMTYLVNASLTHPFLDPKIFKQLSNNISHFLVSCILFWNMSEPWKLGHFFQMIICPERWMIVHLEGHPIL